MATRREITKKYAADYAKSSRTPRDWFWTSWSPSRAGPGPAPGGRSPPRALDLRLVDPALFQHGPTKISAIADLLASVYEEHKDRIFTDPSTGELEPARGALQLVFCDFGTPSKRWNV